MKGSMTSLAVDIVGRFARMSTEQYAQDMWRARFVRTSARIVRFERVV